MHSTRPLITKLIDAIKAANIVPPDRVEFDKVPDPDWDFIEIVTLFEGEHVPVGWQGGTCGNNRDLQVQVISETIETTSNLLERVCEVVEKTLGPTFQRGNQAVGRAISGTKMNTAFVGARNYLVYTKG